jgi:uncharacterized protein with PQ loop repeat
MNAMLSRIPDKYFEITGLLVGLLASLSIAAQIYTECATEKPSTLSIIYVLNFLIVFTFWALYGWRFKRIAVWTTNGLAALLQIVLLIVISIK